MDKNELKSELNDIKAKIKANSKDAHFADTLIAELLSIKGQLDHEPTLAHVALDDIDKTLSGDTFNIYAMKNGDAVYRLKGGLTIVVSNGFYALNTSLRDYVYNQDEIDELDESDKELYANDLLATTMIMNLPTIAFSDLDAKYDLYDKVLEWLIGLQQKLLVDVDLQDETPEEDKKFIDATIAMDAISDVLTKEENKR